MQQILVVYYSQSGQLKDIVNQFVAPFQSAGIGIDFYSIEMEESFPFPWTDEAFFGAFPESFLQIPQPIKPIKQEFLENSCLSGVVLISFYPYQFFFKKYLC